MRYSTPCLRVYSLWSRGSTRTLQCRTPHDCAVRKAPDCTHTVASSNLPTYQPCMPAQKHPKHAHTVVNLPRQLSHAARHPTNPQHKHARIMYQNLRIQRSSSSHLLTQPHPYIIANPPVLFCTLPTIPPIQHVPIPLSTPHALPRLHTAASRLPLPFLPRAVIISRYERRTIVEGRMFQV
jgi:hypothetical protein